MTAPGERLFAFLIRLYPRPFREQYEADLHAFFQLDRDHPKYGAGPLRPLRFWIATLRDILKTAWNHRRDHIRAQPAAPAPRRPGRWLRDLRVAWRGLWSAPLVTVAAIAVLTMGIGASTAIFSVVDAVSLRGLPYPDDDELVLVRETPKGTRNGRAPARPQTYSAWRERQRVFSSIGAATGAPRQTTTDEPVETLTSAAITASLLDVLQVRPALGRPFFESDERSGAAPVALISDRVWRNRFGSSATVVGQRIALRSGTVEIVGVMPPDFRYPVQTASADMFVPFVPTPAMSIRGKTNIYTLTVIGRLAAGVTVEHATSHMTSLQQSLTAEDPAWFDAAPPPIGLWMDSIVSAPVQSWMWLLLGAVAAVLLIACLNVANLLVARAVTRAPELALRTALGASRWDLSRALLIESVLLSLIGAAGGVLLALWTVDLLRATLPANLPRVATIAVDLRVIGVAVAAAIATGLAFGTLPALHASRPNLVSLVGQGARTHSGGRAARGVRMALVVSEVAVASVLLVGSGLFLASFLRVTSIDLGFDPRNVLAVTGGWSSTSAVRPPATAEARAKVATGQTLLTDAIDRLRAVPGVTAVAAVGGGRPFGGSMTMQLRQFDAPPAALNSEVEPWVRIVTSGYLDVLRGAMVRGRWIADGDAAGAEPVMVVNDAAVRRYFGDRDPIGQRVRLGGAAEAAEFTVVGIVRAMRPRSPEDEIRPEVFVPLFQTSYSAAALIVRTTPDPLSLRPALHAALRSAMPDVVPIAETIEQDYAQLIAQRKFNMIVLGIFGVVAVVVAALGIYGLMAYLVEQRRREIGVRVALGADPAGILGMVLRSAAGLMMVGLVAGIAASALLEQLVRAFLFEPRAWDPLIYGGAALALFGAGLFAAIGPARRAARVDPLIALRAE